MESSQFSLAYLCYLNVIYSYKRKTYLCQLNVMYSC